jgi:hypothetical protein
VTPACWRGWRTPGKSDFICQATPTARSAGRNSGSGTQRRTVGPVNASQPPVVVLSSTATSRTTSAPGGGAASSTRGTVRHSTELSGSPISRPPTGTNPEGSARPYSARSETPSPRRPDTETARPASGDAGGSRYQSVANVPRRESAFAPGAGTRKLPNTGTSDARPGGGGLVGR